MSTPCARHETYNPLCTACTINEVVEEDENSTNR